VSNLDTQVPRRASGVPQKNPRNGRRCPRCRRRGLFAANSIVCHRCTSTRPLLITVSVSVTFAALDGDR
jgi:hypothetical protein